MAIQEYMDVSLRAIELLRGNLTERTGKPWAKVLSPRVGKQPNAEQYVYLYRYDRTSSDYRFILKTSSNN